jgi:hypothetical protein
MPCYSLTTREIGIGSHANFRNCERNKRHRKRYRANALSHLNPELKQNVLPDAASIMM